MEHIKSSGHNPGKRIETERTLLELLGVSAAALIWRKISHAASRPPRLPAFHRKI
jgi:hypothetical protein